MFSGLGVSCKGMRSVMSKPKPSRPPYLAGLFVMTRMVVTPRSTSIWAPMPYSRLSTGRPCARLASPVSCRMAVVAEKEKAASATYLTKAAAEPGAVKTDSGLIYRELTAGTGESPKATDTVKVHYRGTLTNGTEFDSSYKRNEPTTFPLNGVIKCWTEGVQRMKVGGKSMLICPSDIAYGNVGHPPTIPGGATLTFEIELLEIVAAKAPVAPPAPVPPPAPAPKPPIK